MVSKTYPFAPSMLKVAFLYDQIISKSHENNSGALAREARAQRSTIGKKSW